MAVTASAPTAQYMPVVRRLAVRGAQSLALALVLAVLPSCRPALLSAQTIAVVVAPGFRPTAVLQPHVRFVVATDSNDGRAILRELAIPPVAFAGTIRIEGVQPGARAPETRPFADTARFESDGRVLLQLADGADRPPMSVEVIGARGAASGRLVITAPRFPLGRVLLVTIAPADLFDLIGHNVGFGVRDRLRIDDRGGMAYLADATAGPTTVAIGFGPGTHGRIQSDLSSVVLSRDFGGIAGQERRQVAALLLAADPSRDEAGTARAELVFGVGNSESDAAQAARAASAETPRTPPVAPLRLRTPSAEVGLLLRHLMAAAGWMLDWDVLNGERTMPASASRPAVRALDAWQGVPLARQRGDTAAVCGSYRSLRRVPGAAGAAGAAEAARIEIAPRLGANGRYLAASDSTDPAADGALVLLAHACYAATRNAALLRLDWPALVASATYAAREAPRDLGGEALSRLGDLDDELTRLSGGERRSSGDSLRAEAARVAGQASALPVSALWRGAGSEAHRGVTRDYGRLSAGGDEGGVSFAAAGSFIDLVVGELFGVTEFLDRLEIAPQLDSIADLQTWQLDGWLLSGGDTLGITYRPADRGATIRLTASQRRRVVLRFPWLSASSCVTARRGPDTERLALVLQSDGSGFVDVRGAFDAAELRVAAGGCER